VGIAQDLTFENGNQAFSAGTGSAARRIQEQFGTRGDP
jgi:hypothetical protein